MSPPLLTRALRHVGKGDGHVAGRELLESSGCRSFGAVDLLVASNVLALLDLRARCGRQLTCPSKANVGVAAKRELPGPSAKAVAQNPGSGPLGRQGEGQAATVRTGLRRTDLDPVPDLNVR
jgi:hypothetical protein